MGRFLASLLLLLVACGDNLPVVGSNAPPGATSQPPATPGGPTARLVPAVCEASSWTNVPIPSMQSDLAVAGDPTSTAVLAVPSSGGTLVGFTLDRGMARVTGSTKIATAAPFSSIAVAQLGDQFFAAGVDASGPTTVLERLAPDLSSPVELAKIAGGIVAKPAVLALGRGTVVAVGGAGEVTFEGFDGTWSSTGEIQVKTNGPVTGLTAAPFGGEALVAWSTAATCGITKLADMTPGKVTQIDGACTSPRLAADAAGGTEGLVYTSGGAVLFKYFANNQLGRGPEQLEPYGRAPRIVFDGTRYWVSYLDQRGDVVVGDLDSGGHLTSTALFGTRPADEAYELVVTHGAPWVFALDANGYTAQRMCLVPEQ